MFHSKMGGLVFLLGILQRFCFLPLFSELQLFSDIFPVFKSPELYTCIDGEIR